MKNKSSKDKKSSERQQIIEDFGHRLKLLRTELKIHQKDMAKKLEVSPSYISELESGKMGPGFEFMYKFGLHYNMNPLYLLYGKEPKLLDNFNPEAKPLPAESISQSALNDQTKEMIYYMEKSKLIRYAMSEQLRAYCLRNKDLIKKDLEESESRPNKDDSTF